MSKRLNSLLIVIVLLLTLASSCTTDVDKPGGQTPSQTPSQATPTQNSETPATDEEGLELPLVAETMKFTMWAPAPRADSGMVDQNDSIARQELQRRTNIAIEWQHPSLGQEAVQFNLLLASQMYPDALVGISTYLIGGWDKYVDEGFVLDLTPYTKYMTNYMERRSVNDGAMRNTITDAGRICFFQDIRKTMQPSWIGPGVRRDLLTELDLDIPVTMDDYENMLIAFKERLNIKNPMMITSNTGMDRMLMSSYNMFYDIYQTDGIIRYPAYEPQYLDYLKLMNKWYDNGLIDQEFFNKNTWTDNEPDLLSGKSVATTTLAYINIDRYDLQTEGDAVDWYPMEVPLLEEGFVRKIYSWGSPYYASNYTTNLTTSVDEDKIPILLKYFDYLFTDEGSDLANYGILGETYDIGSSGKAEFKDFIYNNPEGMSFSSCMTKYAIFYSSSSYYDWEREITPTMSEKAWPLTGEVWDKSITDPQLIPGASVITISADKIGDYSALYSDLKTYVEEMTAKFIMGQVSLDNYGNFISELEKLGVKQIIQMQQEAYDNYLNRDISIGY